MSDTATLTWTDQVEPGTVNTVRALLERAAEVDGVAPVSEQAVLSSPKSTPRPGMCSRSAPVSWSATRILLRHMTNTPQWPRSP